MPALNRQSLENLKTAIQYFLGRLWVFGFGDETIGTALILLST